MLFEKAQKILDRFIFICFCEDKGLLPDHTFRSVLTNAQHTFVPKTNVIWDELKGLFLSIDEGNPRVDISRYNGGLFHQDDVLDHLTVADDALKEFKKISDCNFDSDLNVNILGHIFKQSISDIEQIKAEINDESADPKKSKKKKDGIYYTPGYVTRYIVEKQSVAG